MVEPKILILAGGQSERFWPLGDKALLPFLGRTLIENQIERVKGVGFKDIIVVCNKENLPVIKDLGVKAVLQRGKGQAAAILSVKKFLNGLVLVVNANDFFDPLLFKQVIRAGQKNGVDVCLVGFKTTAYFPGGYLVVDKNHRVRKIIEKPAEGKEPSNLVRIVVDFFQEGEKLVEYLKKNILYEEALDQMIQDGLGVYAISYQGDWAYLKYPWHALLMTDFFLKKIKTKKIGQNVQISKKAIIAAGPVIIKDNVRIFENVKIVGPAYIGKNTIIGNNSIIRQSMIGADCVIGFSTEITRSYIGDQCWFHTNYTGDSVLDTNVSLGAGAVLANLRLDENTICSVVKEKRVNTQRTKLGAIVGKNVRIGVNASIMPGIKIGKNSFIGAGVVLNKDLAENKFCYFKQEKMIVKENFKRVKKGEREKLREKVLKA